MEMIGCPECGASIGEDEIVCPFCSAYIYECEEGEEEDDSEDDDRRES